MYARVAPRRRKKTARSVSGGWGGRGGGNVRDTPTMARSAGTERPEPEDLDVGSSARSSSSGEVVVVELGCGVRRGAR